METSACFSGCSSSASAEGPVRVGEYAGGSEAGKDSIKASSTGSGACSDAEGNFYFMDLGKGTAIQKITPDGNVIMTLDVTKDQVGGGTGSFVQINTKHVKTEVLVENGGTVVIGGIFELTETENETRVPLLGDIPIAGNLFKSKTRSSNKQEMLVFITPKMIADRAAAR